MKLSKLIREADAALKKYGDLDVYVFIRIWENGFSAESVDVSEEDKALFIFCDDPDS